MAAASSPSGKIPKTPAAFGAPTPPNVPPLPLAITNPSEVTSAVLVKLDAASAALVVATEAARKLEADQGVARKHRQPNAFKWTAGSIDRSLGEEAPAKADDSGSDDEDKPSKVAFKNKVRALTTPAASLARQVTADDDTPQARADYYEDDTAPTTPNAASGDGSAAAAASKSQPATPVFQVFGEPVTPKAVATPVASNSNGAAAARPNSKRPATPMVARPSQIQLHFDGESAAAADGAASDTPHSLTTKSDASGSTPASLLSRHSLSRTAQTPVARLSTSSMGGGAATASAQRTGTAPTTPRSASGDGSAAAAASKPKHPTTPMVARPPRLQLHFDGESAAAADGAAGDTPDSTTAQSDASGATPASLMSRNSLTRPAQTPAARLSTSSIGGGAAAPSVQGSATPKAPHTPYAGAATPSAGNAGGGAMTPSSHGTGTAPSTPAAHSLDTIARLRILNLTSEQS